MENIEIKRATIDYAESYCNTVDKVARERKYLASTEGFPLESTIGFVKMIEDNNLAQFYAIKDDQVIGWCDILPKRFEGLRHVGNLGMGILDEYRGCGIGSKLLEYAVQHAQTFNGVEKIELEVFGSNTAAIKLYEKYEFIFEGKRENARKLDGDYDSVVLMGKQLG